MKIKLDENIPARLVDILQQLGHDVDTVPDERLTGHSDAAVWEAAQADGRFLITQDLDFSDINRFAPGTHAGLLLVRLRNPSRAALIRTIQTLFQAEAVADWQRCLVVATERKLRIRPPQ